MLMMSRSVFVLVSFVYVWLEKRSKVEVSSALVSRCVCGLNKCLFWLIFKLVEEFLCGCILLHFEIVNKLMFCFYWIYLLEEDTCGVCLTLLVFSFFLIPLFVPSYLDLFLPYLLLFLFFLVFLYITWDNSTHLCPFLLILFS